MRTNLVKVKTEPSTSVKEISKGDYIVALTILLKNN